MFRAVLILSCASALLACSGKDAASKDDAPAQIKSAVPVPSFAISKSPADIAKGQEVFAEKGCTACHKVGGGKLVGPDLKGVTARRDEAWIKRMILRPDVMIKEDELAKKLFAEHLTPMPNQNVDPQRELPPLLAYLKSVE
jgi:mono/diheme cytochrome c family protein